VREVLEYLAKSQVGDLEAVDVTEVTEGSTVALRLSVAPEDMGKVIGRGGRTIRAIRDVVRAAATRAGVTATVEIVE
jgi:predicted RNA-binding protein YlqC (UPF0109 family)